MNEYSQQRQRHQTYATRFVVAIIVKFEFELKNSHHMPCGRINWLTHILTHILNDILHLNFNFVKKNNFPYIAEYKLLKTLVM